MTSFYIVPPRKTQLGDNGISISGTLGVITTNPGGAAITGVGALKLDTTYSPTWTGIHTYTQPIVFAGSQVINSTLISTTGQTAGDLFYYTGTSWSRLAVGSNNQVLQSFGGGIGWTGGVNLSNVITGNLKIGSLNGVLKASSGIVSGNSGIGDLSNVVLNLPANGNFLKYNGTNWVNSPIPLSDHNIIIRFLNGYTPVQTGIDIEIALVPYEPSDGTTVLEYTITRIIFQVEVAGSTASQITIERALLGQEFDNPMTLGNTIETLSLGGGVYTVSSTGPFFKIYSGERLRLNINSIGTGAQQWTVQIEGTAGNPYNGTNAGITSINSLAAQLQNMVVGSGGTDFNISSVIDTHTFNIPSASATNRGLVTTGSQTFAGVKTFNNTSASISTTSGAIIVNGGVGIGETLNVGGNVVVGNNLILNNPIPVQSGGTGLTTLGSANSLLAVNNAASALEYKNLIAGAGISINFSSSNITLDVTGSANTGNIGFNNDVIYNTLNNTIYISPSDQYVGYSYIAVPNDNDATVSPLAIGNLVGSIQITSGTSISNSYTWTFNSDGTLSSPYYTFPNNDGANGQALITDGAGNLAWGNVSATGSGGGISSLNGISYINYPVQNFAIGSAGTNFNIVSIGSTHTFNLPEAGSGASGIVTTGSQTFSGVKTFANNLIAQSDINVSGSSNLLSAVGVSSTLNVAGGFGVTGATVLRSTLQVQGVSTLTNNTNASSSTSGSLVVTGGVGISGALYVGSGANINSNNISGTLTNSGLVFSGNSLTTGTGFYVASSSLTTGKLIDVVVSGNTATGARTGINVSIGGSNANTGVTTYGILVNNTSSNSGNNIGLGLFASGVTNNIPLRLGLNNTNRYINFFINSEGNGLTLSPTGNGTPFLALGGYSGVVGELRLLQSGGIGDPNYVALKAPVTVTNRYELIFPDSYPSSSGMTLIGTGTTQVTLSWSSLGAGGIGGTINAGDQYKLAFYVNPNGSSVLDDAQALNYSTSGANLTINSTAASVVPLKLVGAVSQTADLLQVATSSANIFNIDKDGISTFTNNLVVSSSTASTSSSTGALTVTGGLGVQGRVFVGTGLSVATGANFASTVEINTLRLLNVLTLSNGGTGLGTSGLPNQILGMNSSSSSLEYKTINVGFGITVAHSPGGITISTTSSGSGISSINSLTSSEQTFAIGSSGTNFNIVSSGSTHTFNLPSAGVGSSGIITTSAQSIAGNKSFTDIIVASGLGVTNSATFRSTVDIFGGLGVTGAVTFRDALTVNGVTTISNNTNSTSSLNGALVVSGGVGVGGTVYTNNLYVSGLINLANPLAVTNGGTGTNNGSITGTGALTFTAGGSNTNINLVPNGTGTVDVASKRITSVATPTLPSDAVTKAYVDQIAQGINYHDHVEAATTAGLGATYQNGVNGVGATLQASPSAGWSTSYSDGVTLTVGDRILVKNQTGAGVTVQNGIYVVSQLTSPWRLTRSSDYDNSIPGSVGPGDTVWVAFGNTLQYTTWTQSAFGTGDSSGGILIGTDPITYIQTSGAGSYNGDGSTISITGSIISIAPGYVGQTSITTLGTITTGAWNGSVINTLYGGTGASSFTSNGVLYGNGTSAIQATSASSSVGALLTTTSSGGAPSFSTTLQGQYTVSNNTNSTSSTTGALSITGGLGVSGNVFLGSNLNVVSSANFGTTLGVSSSINIGGGLGITGASLFRSSVIIQSGGLGVTGGVVVTQGGLGVTGATVLNSSLTVSAGTILNSTLNVAGSANFASSLNVGGPSSLAGIGISGSLDVTGGLGITGSSLFRSSVIVQSGGLGVTGGIVVTSGGLGVTGATTLRSTLSVLGTASFATINQGSWNGSTVGLAYGGTGLGSSGTANQMLGMSNDSSSLEYKSLVAGSNITILHSTNSITISSTSGGGGGSGVVNTGLATQVAYYAVGGTSVSGTSNLTVGTTGVGVSFTTQSTSSTSGSLIVAGGIGVSGNVRVGSGLGVSGALNFVSGTFGNVGASTFTLNFLSSGNSPISLNVLSDNSLSFEGSSGQLLSISNNLSSGFIYSINNISGLPLFRANANGNVVMGEFTGNIGVGTSIPQFKLHVIGDTNITGGFGVSGSATISGGVGITGNLNLSSTLIVQGNTGIVGGLGVTGASLFRSSVIVQSGGLGVSGGIVVSQGGLGVTGSISADAIAVRSQGIGITGTVTADNIVISGGLGVTGASIFRNNVIVQSGGLGVTGGIAITQGGLGVTGGVVIYSSGLAINSGGIGVTGASIFRNTLSIQSGGLGVTGQSVFYNNVEIQSGGLGVTGRISGGTGLSITGAATITGSLSASSLTLINALSISNGGTGLGTSGTANQILGMNNASSALEYKLIAGGSGIAISNSPNVVTISYSGGGITSLNSLTGASQTFATGTSGTEFNIVSSGSTHTFNLPAAGTGSSGTVTTGAQTFAGNKTFNGITSFASSTASTSISSGSLIVTGGVGIAGTSYVGNTLFASSLFVADNTQSTSSTSGAVQITGGLGVSGRITTGTGLSVLGAATITGSLSASSLTLINALSISNGGTGLGTSGTANQILGMNNASSALEYKVIVAGSGIAVSNSPNAITLSTTGGGITSLNSLTSGSQTFATGTSGTEFNIVSSGSTHTFNIPAAGTGSSGTVTTGTQTFAGAKTFNGITTFASATSATSSSSGGLIVSGGVGIAGTSYVGNTLFTSTIFVADNTNSTSSTSGSLQVTGGLGVSGRIFGGTGLSITGAASINSTVTINGATILNSTLYANGPAIIQSGGLGVTGGIAVSQGGLGVTGAAVLNSSLNVATGTILNSTLNVYGNVNFASSMNVAGPSSLAGVGVSGNLDVTGGLGITGASLFRSSIIIQNGGLGVTGGIVISQGGLGVTGAAVFRSTVQSLGSVTVNSNTNSSSSTSGAVVITGGLGVSGNVYIGTGLSVSGSATFRSGTSATGTAPIYLTSGTNLTTPESGALEFDGTYLYFTPSTVRKQVSNIAVSGTAPSGSTSGDFWWDASSGVLKIYYDSYWVETTGPDIYTAISNQILSINDNTNSTSSTSGAVIVTGGIGVSGNLNVGSGLGVSGLTSLTYTSEKLSTKSSATGVVTHDLTTGSIFYHSSISNNFTANITNVPDTNDRAIGVTLVLSQGATAYMATALQIDGNAQTIKWINNSVPSGAANKVDVVGFSLIRTGSTWTVLGQYSTYG